MDILLSIHQRRRGVVETLMLEVVETLVLGEVEILVLGVVEVELIVQAPLQGMEVGGGGGRGDNGDGEGEGVPSEVSSAESSDI